MKKLDITKRELTFFFLGILTMFLIVLIYERKDFYEGLKEGWNSSRKEGKR
jgi:hypothetical protein